MSDLAFLSVAEAGKLIRGRKLSPVELLEALLARIETPELGEQLRLARARLREAQDNVPLVQSAYARASQLTASGSVAP